MRAANALDFYERYMMETYSVWKSLQYINDPVSKRIALGSLDNETSHKRMQCFVQTGDLPPCGVFIQCGAIVCPPRLVLG